jgi:trigger factor
MKTGLKEVNSFTRELDVTVGWDKLSAGFEKEFKKAKSNFELKGFRKGKVPLNIVKKNLLPSIEAHFAEHSLNEYYRKALDELELNPINQAQINKLHFHEGCDLEFVAEFEVSPEVKLPKYERKFKIKTTRYMATQEDVDAALKEIRERHSTIKTIEDGAKTGHFINGDFQELDEAGNQLEGRKLEKQYIKLGEAAFSGDSEKPFYGARSGDEITAEIAYEENKKVNYLVNVHKVEEQILPDLDDEFALIADPAVKTMDELNEKLMTQIQTSLDREHEKEIQKEIMEYFVKKSKLDAPKSMIDNYLEHVLDDVKNKNQNNQSIDEENLKNAYRETAESSVKWYLIKDAIITSAGLDVSKDLVQAKIDEFIKQKPKQKNEIMKFYRQSKNKEKLFEDLLNESLFKHLKEFATNKISEKSTIELKKGKK